MCDILVDTGTKLLRSDIKRLERDITMKLLPRNILMICINNDTLSHKRTSVSSQSSVQSSTAPANRNDNKVTIPDEEQMNRNLKALQGEFNDNNSDKENGIDDGEDDDFKELAEELNKEEQLGEPMQQSLANILEAIWQNPQSYER